MTRFEIQPSAPRTEEERTVDTLFERWLRRDPRSQNRVCTEPPRPIATRPAPIGDELADAWFK